MFLIDQENYVGLFTVHGQGCFKSNEVTDKFIWLEAHRVGRLNNYLVSYKSMQQGGSSDLLQSVWHHNLLVLVVTRKYPNSRYFLGVKMQYS